MVLADFPGSQTFTAMKNISVCIVDDNRELRNALEEIISMSDGYKCVGTLATPEDAIRQIPLIKPDVVLMDINLGSSESGIESVRMPVIRGALPVASAEDDDLPDPVQSPIEVFRRCAAEIQSVVDVMIGLIAPIPIMPR